MTLDREPINRINRIYRDHSGTNCIQSGPQTTRAHEKDAFFYQSGAQLWPNFLLCDFWSTGQTS
jgi:hypothetical protein